MSKVKDITDNDLESYIKESEKPLFIDFWAEWCGPCKMVGPVIDELSDEHDDITFVKINVDENPDATAKYGVRSIPTFVVIKDSEIVFRHSGAVPKSFFNEKLKSYVK